jgi:predicted phosphodiesterase
VGIEGQRLFNPGSATERRAQPRHTYGVLDLDAGRVAAHAIVALT